MTIISERLRDIRKRRSLTQTALARIVGLSRESINAFEQGRAASPESITKLAAGLSVSVDFMCGNGALCNVDPVVIERLRSAAASGDAHVTILAGDLQAVLEAFEPAETSVEEKGRSPQSVNESVDKQRFWQHAAGTPVRPRQVRVLNRLLEGPTTQVTSMEWAVIAACSRNSALRDINELVDYGLLRKSSSGGRAAAPNRHLAHERCTGAALAGWDDHDAIELAATVASQDSCLL